MVKQSRLASTDYVFSSTLETFLKDQLRYLELDKNMDKKIDAGGNQISNKEFKELNKTKRLLQRRKVDILDKHIFRSMANLILFFEYLKKYPELHEIFEDDIKELFGYIGKPPTRTYTNVKKERRLIRKDDGTKEEIERDVPFLIRCGEVEDYHIMRRFLESLLYWDMRKDFKNFRLELLEEIFAIFWRHFTSLSMTQGPGKIPNNVINSIEHIEYLIKLYSVKYAENGKKQDLEKEPKRLIGFKRL